MSRNRRPARELDDYLHQTRYDDAKTHTAHTQMRDELYRKMDESPENNHENLVDRATNVVLQVVAAKATAGLFLLHRQRH